MKYSGVINKSELKHCLLSLFTHTNLSMFLIYIYIYDFSKVLIYVCIHTHTHTHFSMFLIYEQIFGTAKFYNDGK